MKRLAMLAGALVALASPATALAAQSTSGTITAIQGGSFTIQTAGPRIGVINALTRTADAITRAVYPYVWGGGHGAAGIASVGIKGPGHNGRSVGFDCSGSVAAVLAGAGLWPAGAGVPNDYGVIVQLRREGLIARGAAPNAGGVTLYDHPGVHIFMNINGRFFGTSDGSGGGNRKGGAGWLYDGAWDATSRVFKRWHFLPSVLHNRTSYGQLYTFQAGTLGAVPTGLQVGDKVSVGYRRSGVGTLVASAVGYLGAVTVSGTVGTIAPDGSTFTVTGSDGRTLPISTSRIASLLAGLQAGDTVSVTYTRAAGVLTAHALSITGTPAPVPTTTTPTPTSTGTGDGSGYPGDGYGGYSRG
jgi:hypothetical protein